MIGNSLVPVLTSNNDQGFIITASYEFRDAYRLNSAYKVFDNTNAAANRWSAVNGAPPHWIQIEFPKTIKITGIMINLSATAPAPIDIKLSKDKINYSSFLVNILTEGTNNLIELTPSITRFIKFLDNSSNTPIGGIMCRLNEAQIYGFYSPGKFLMKTNNDYIYNSNSTDINSITVENINSNNTLPEFIEECSSDINNINETFSVIKLVK